jgi:hypothetical protein
MPSVFHVATMTAQVARTRHEPGQEVVTLLRIGNSVKMILCIPS